MSTFTEDKKKYEKRKDTKGREFEEFGGKRYTQVERYEALNRPKKDGTPSRVTRVSINNGAQRLVIIAQQGGAIVIVEATTNEGQEPK